MSGWDETDEENVQSCSSVPRVTKRNRLVRSCDLLREDQPFIEERLNDRPTRGGQVHRSAGQSPKVCAGGMACKIPGVNPKLRL